MRAEMERSGQNWGVRLGEIRQDLRTGWYGTWTQESVVSNEWASELVKMMCQFLFAAATTHTNEWPETVQMYSLIVLEVKSPKSVSQDWGQDVCRAGSFWSLYGRIPCLPFSASSGHLYPLASGPLLHLQTGSLRASQYLLLSEGNPSILRNVAITSVLTGYCISIFK